MQTDSKQKNLCDIDSITFVVATKYNLIISYILRDSFPKSHKKRLIISDSFGEAEEICAKMKDIGSWDDIIYIKTKRNNDNCNNKKLANLLNGIQLKRRVERIIDNNSIFDLCFFTHGDEVSRICTSSDKLRNLYLGEDGTFPYYGGLEMYDTVKMLTFNSKPVGNENSASSILNNYLPSLVKYFIKRFFLQHHLIVDYGNRVNAMILLRPDLYNKNYDKRVKYIVPASYDLDKVKEHFEELTKVFAVEKNTIYNAIDVIFFDSGMVSGNEYSDEQKIEFTLHLLSYFKDKRVLIRLSPNISADTKKVYTDLCREQKNILLDENNVNAPWEVIYYNNIDQLRKVTLVSYRCTACFSSYFLFGIENEIVVFSNLLQNQFNMNLEDKAYNKLFTEFMENIRKKYKFKNIYIPNSKFELSFTK
jgi:hypothetical protein